MTQAIGRNSSVTVYLDPDVMQALADFAARRDRSHFA